MSKINIPEYRQCARCGMKKPLEAFYTGATVCKLCLKPRTSKYIIEELEQKEKTFEWVYRVYNENGNVLIAKKHYKKLDLSRLGKHSIRELQKENITDNACFILTKE